MKKILGVGLLVSVFLLTGCGKNTVKTMVCDSTAKQGNIDMVLHYEVTYSGDYVKTVNTKEQLTSSSTATLEGYKKQIETLYKNFDGIDHYSYNIDLKDNTLTSTVSIDYEKVDIDKILAVDSSTEQLIKNGKININDIKEVYEQVGATCKVEK